MEDTTPNEKATARPFRFAVQTGPFRDPAALRAHALNAEQLGYDELYTSDHIGNVDPFIPLIVASEATTTLRVGPLVLNNELHHPALLARTALSVDQLTSGRLLLGLGTGYARSEHDAIGLELRAPAERVDRFGESLTVLRSLLDTGTSSFHGEHHTIDVDNIGLSATQSHIPFVVGGHGPRVVALAGRFADIFQFTGLTHTADGTIGVDGFPIERLDERARWLADAAGERINNIERSALVQHSSIGADAADPDDLAQEFKLDASVLADTPFVLSGSHEQIVDKLERTRERLGISHYVIRDPMVSRRSSTPSPVAEVKLSY